MIYLFDREKTVTRGIDYLDFTTLKTKEVINGTIEISLEIGINQVLSGDNYSSNIKEIFKGAEFVGHFDDNQDFQLYRIIRPSVNNNKLSFYGIHIFHDESQAKTVINDRRWRDSQAWTVLEDAYAYIGWVLTDYETSKVLDHNAFRQTPAQVRAEVIDAYGVEVQPYLEFDGKKITRKCFRVKNKLGTDTYERFDYGSDLLTIRFEEDLGDIYTAVIGRGKGEEAVANSKIEFQDIVWKKSNGDPVDKPLGQNFVELPEATQKYGYVEGNNVYPRLIKMDFDNIEDKRELLQETYDWLVANSLPKILLEADVFSIGNYQLGDIIGIVYKQAGVVRKMRIHEIERDLRSPKLTKFKIGDYDHFIKNTVTRQYRKKLNKLEQSTNQGLENLNTQFNEKMEYEIGEVEKKAEAVKDYADAQIIAKEKIYEERWDVRDKALNDSIEKLAGGSLDGLQTNLSEIYTEMLTKLTQADLEPLDARLTTVTNQIQPLQDNLQTVTNDLATAKTELQRQLDEAKTESGDNSGKITTLTQQLEFVEGELSAKLEQADIDPLEGKITEYGNTLTANAQSIESLLAKSELHDGDITTWKNSTIANADSISNILEKNTEQDGLITTWSNETKKTAEGLTETMSRTTANETEIGTVKQTASGIQRDFTAYKTSTDGDIVTINSELGTIKQTATSLESDFTTYKETTDGDIVTINSELGTVKQTAESLESDFSTYKESTDGDISTITSELGTVKQTASGIQQDFTAYKETTSGTLTTLDTEIGTLKQTASGLQTEFGNYKETTDGTLSTLNSEIGTVKQTANSLETNFSTYKKSTDGQLSTMSGNMADIKTTAEGTATTVSSMKPTLDSLDTWRANNGTLFEQTADAFKLKVWRDDIITGGTNLFTNTDFSSMTDINAWRKLVGDISRSWSQFMLIQNLTYASFFGAISERNLEIVKGKTYTVSFLGAHDNGIDTINRVFLLDDDFRSVQNLNEYRRVKYMENPHVTTNFSYGLYYFTFTAEVTQRVGICISAVHNGYDKSGGWFRISEPQFEEGNVPSSYKPPMAEYMHQTDFVIESDGFLLGTRRVGGDVFSSGIVGTPSALKLLGDNIDVHGNLNVKGDVESWSVSAVTANIGSIFANTVKAGFIDGDHINMNTAFIKDLVGKNAFIDNAQIKASNIRDLTTVSLKAEQMSGGTLKDQSGNMNWNLNTGRFAIKNSTFVYEQYGNAMVFGKDGYTGGLVFSQDTIEALPVVAIGTSLNTGTTLNPRLSLNAYTFNGISFFSGNSGENQTNLTTDNMLFRSEAGEGSQFDRGLRLTMYDLNNATDVTLEPYSARPLVYKHYLGTNSNPFTGMYTTNLWKARVRDSGSGVTFSSQNGKYGISVSNGGVFAVKDGKFTALLI